MTLVMHKPPYLGIQLVISGGQTGADQGGLAGAKHWGIPTGGKAPKGWRTAQGPMPQLQSLYGLVESASAAYEVRTRENVAAADATIIIATNPSSPGTRQTKRFCTELGKPFIVIRQFDLQEHIFEATAWAIENEVSTLNVAGNRDFGSYTVHYDMAEKVISSIINLLMIAGYQRPIQT